MKTLESLDYDSLIFYHHQAWYCDGTPDCEDKSDEPKTCGVIDCQSNYFKCDNSKCIYKSFVCDGTDDCGDNSDESSKHACSAPEVVCESGEWQCPGVTGVCIPTEKVRYFWESCVVCFKY